MAVVALCCGFTLIALLRTRTVTSDFSRKTQKLHSRVFFVLPHTEKADGGQSHASAAADNDFKKDNKAITAVPIC